MGNTSSSSSKASSKLKRDPSIISSPRSLHNRAPLGPEFAISPASNRSQVSIQGNISTRRSFSTSATSLRVPDASDFRRTRSANASPGPSREARTQELLGAPPPYTLHDASSSNIHLSRQPSREALLAVPGTIPQAQGHRRTVSAITPGDMRDPRIQTAFNGDGRSQRSLSPSPDLKAVPEELGYGVGSGLKPGSKHVRVVMLAPAASTSSLRSSTSHTGGHAGRTTPRQAISRKESTPENPLELLKRYKTIFIIDDSSSMAGESWTEAREALASLAEAAANYGQEGIDAHFLNAKRSAQNLRSAASVKRQFDSIRPQGISLIAEKLEALLEDYLSNLEAAKQAQDRGDLLALQRIRPINFIIITDGAPTDDPEPVIVQAARRLDSGHFPLSQVGIQFVQIGSDPRATEALQELDDELAKTYGIRDMVDTTIYTGGPLDAEMLIKILLGGINRRVDKKGAKGILS